MRATILAVLVTAGIGLFGASMASAAPGGNTALLNASNDVSGVVQVSDGCGRGWHRNWRGECRPDRYWRRRY
jgi:hypothetical protein